MKNFTKAIVLITGLLSFGFIKTTNAQLSSLSEDFDNVVPTDWVVINNSTGNKSTGASTWYQGDPRQFSSYDGAATSYATASYLSVGGKNAGTISNWLITPVLKLVNGSTFSFYTRSAAPLGGVFYPDRLEVRLSTNGSSTNVGNTEESTGDFSVVLKTINPDLEPEGYPDTGWTKYEVTISVGGNVNGRIAFRYYVTDGGSNGNNSSFIGIDEFNYETVLPVSLLNFKGLIKDNKAELSWSTAEEINNKGFEVQASHDNLSYSTIGFVAANGSKPGVHNYSYTDDKIVSGNNYYRLKQVDLDGQYRYSSVVKLQLSRFAWTVLNNTTSTPTIQLQTEAQSKVVVQLVSSTGKVMQVINKGLLPAGTVNIPLYLNNTTHGIYFIKLSVDDKSYTKEIMKQ